jgi:cytidylate kinase
MTELPVARLPAVVTIAALYGAGGTRIASRVAERLGVQFLDRALPDENPRSRSQRLLTSFSRAAPPTSASGQVDSVDLEHQRLRGELEAFFADTAGDGGVILGRGAAVVLADVPSALHVHLGGPRPARVERVMASTGVNRDTAVGLVKANDRARRDYVRSAYGVDGDNPALYHLMIDTIAVGIDASVDLVIAASQARLRQAAEAA